MDFFSGSFPNLISNNSIKNVEEMLNINSVPISDTPIETFYTKYIEPNKLFIIVFVLISIFLLYKYYTKDIELKTNDDNDLVNLTNDIDTEDIFQDIHLQVKNNTDI